MKTKFITGSASQVPSAATTPSTIGSIKKIFHSLDHRSLHACISIVMRVHFFLFSSSILQHVNFDPDLYSHILRLRGSHLSPGRLLVVVHLVAYWLLPVDGFSLEGDIEKRRDLKLALTNKLKTSPASARVPPGEKECGGSL